MFSFAHKKIIMIRLNRTLTFMFLIVIKFSFITGQTVITSDKTEENKGDLKINGWIQTQFQWTPTKGATTFDGGDFANNSNNRFMIRRGRLKFTYTKDIAQFVFQINATERGINVADFFAKVNDPWKKGFYIQGGIMNRPFGFEINQSSVDRETPERSRYIQILTPNERDMGAAIGYQAPTSSKLHGLKLEIGCFNGTGINVAGTGNPISVGVVDFDSYKDAIGRITYNRALKNQKTKFGLGFSHYRGGNVFLSNQVFTTEQNNNLYYWKAKDTTNHSFKGERAPRIYYAFDGQFSFKTKIGTTTLRGEYIFGTQTATATDTKSPSAVPSSQLAYIRKFSGGHIYAVQRFGKSKHELVFKYDYYDPNKSVSANNLKFNNFFNKADLRFNSLGFGYNFLMSENVKWMLNYDHVINEKVQGMTGVENDLHDDVLTIRLQLRF